MFTLLKPLGIVPLVKTFLVRKLIYTLVRDAITEELGVTNTDIISVLEIPTVSTDQIAKKLGVVADVIIVMNTSDADLVENKGINLRDSIQNKWKENTKLKNITCEIWIGNFQVWGYVGLPIPQ